MMKSYQSYTDTQLIELVKFGDKDAFAEVYRRYWRILMDAGYQRLKSIEASEEVIQDIFVNLFLRRSEITLQSSLEAYLKTALKYKIFNLYRSQHVRFKYLEEAFVRAESPLMPDMALEAKELKERVLRTAEKMPEKCREVFLLSRFEHLSNQDIATRMDISVSTVKKHITKSMKIMRAEFQGYQIDALAIIFLIQLLSIRL